MAGTREVFRKWSECHTDVETRGSELPASVLHCSGGKEMQGGTDERRSKEQGASNGVRWLIYCCVIPYFIDKLPHKGKNNQSCTV